MKNRKIIKIEKSRAEFVKLKDGRTKVTVTKGYFNENDNWTIWFPEGTADRFGFIPTELVKKRMMHDYAIELGHYSSTLSMEA
jgi:uncharacterized protein YodC (DUF2158 family)